MLDNHSLPDFTESGAGRCSAAGGFQAEHPTGRCRNPYGSAAVAAGSQRHHPGSHSGSGATARTADRMFQIPWVSGRPEQFRFGIGQQTEFRAVRLSQNNKPRLLVACNDFTVCLGNVLFQRLRPACQRNPGIFAEQVFQQEGNAGQGTTFGNMHDGFSRQIIHRLNDGINGWIQRFDTLDGRFTKLGRFDFFFPHQFRQADAIIAGIFTENAHAEFLHIDAAGDTHIPDSRFYFFAMTSIRAIRSSSRFFR